VGRCEEVESASSAEILYHGILSDREKDLLRCLIHRAVERGPGSIGIDEAIWPSYCRRLLEIDGRLRRGPRDEIS